MRSTRIGIFALALVGGAVLIWRNRFQIQKTLESYGIKTSTLKGDLGEAARSVAAKVTGRVSGAVDATERKVSSL